MKTIRSFLALNIDIDVIRRVAAVQTNVKTACEEREIAVKWIPPQNIHLTLRYLGGITEPMVHAIKDNVAPLTRTFPPLEFGISGLGVFPDPESAKVLYAGIDDASGALKELGEQLAAIMVKTGFKNEGNAFLPHITLGRIASASPDAISQLLSQQGNLDVGTSAARDILCYRSDLQTKKTDYHLLWRLALLGKKKQDFIQQDAPIENMQGESTDEEQS